MIVKKSEYKKYIKDNNIQVLDGDQEMLKDVMPGTPDEEINSYIEHIKTLINKSPVEIITPNVSIEEQKFLIDIIFPGEFLNNLAAIFFRDSTCKKLVEEFLKKYKDIVFNKAKHILEILSPDISKENWNEIYLNDKIRDSNIGVNSVPEEVYMSGKVNFKIKEVPTHGYPDFVHTVVSDYSRNKVNNFKSLYFERMDYSEKFIKYLISKNVELRRISNFFLLDNKIVEKYIDKLLTDKELNDKNVNRVAIIAATIENKYEAIYSYISRMPTCGSLKVLSIEKFIELNKIVDNYLKAVAEKYNVSISDPTAEHYVNCKGLWVTMDNALILYIQFRNDIKTRYKLLKENIGMMRSRLGSTAVSQLVYYLDNEKNLDSIYRFKIVELICSKYKHNIWKYAYEKGCNVSLEYIKKHKIEVKDRESAEYFASVLKKIDKDAADYLNEMDDKYGKSSGTFISSAIEGLFVPPFSSGSSCIGKLSQYAFDTYFDIIVDTLEQNGSARRGLLETAIMNDKISFTDEQLEKMYPCLSHNFVGCIIDKYNSSISDSVRLRYELTKLNN